jgi:hypothetical protein
LIGRGRIHIAFTPLERVCHHVALVHMHPELLQDILNRHQAAIKLEVFPVITLVMIEHRIICHISEHQRLPAVRQGA